MLAGDTLPIDVYCHIPIMCEDRSLPYAYVPSKSVRAAAAQPGGSSCGEREAGGQPRKTQTWCLGKAPGAWLGQAVTVQT